MVLVGHMHDGLRLKNYMIAVSLVVMEHLQMMVVLEVEMEFHDYMKILDFDYFLYSIC